MIHEIELSHKQLNQHEIIPGGAVGAESQMDLYANSSLKRTTSEHEVDEYLKKELRENISNSQSKHYETVPPNQKQNLVQESALARTLDKRNLLPSLENKPAISRLSKISLSP